jgi:hypothetical protein
LKLEREREREFEIKKLRSKGFLSQWSSQPSGGGGDPIYSPHRESACWDVRDPDMSDKKPGHI